MKNTRRGFLLLAFVACAAGCSTTERFTLVAVRNIDAAHFSTRPPQGALQVRRIDDTFFMLGWVTGIVPMFNERMELGLLSFGGPTDAHGQGVQINTLETLARVAPEASIYRDVEIKQTAWSFFLAGNSSIDVRATPVGAPPPRSNP